MSGRRPDFVIVGTMRGGTTSLYRHLADHPEVDAAARKEVRYFNLHHDKGDDWYRAQFPAGGGRITGEATPSYMFEPVAIDRMATTIPDAKLIAVLRDPVDRAWSHYLLRQSQGFEQRPFAAAVGLVDAPKDVPGAEFDDYVGRGRYLAQLQHIVSRFPREQLRVHLFDDLSRDPAGVYRDTCVFLGIDPSFDPPLLDTPVNAHVTFRSATLRKVLRRRAPGWLQTAVGRVNAKATAPPALDPAVRAELVAEFRADNAALAEWLGRDLSHWGV